MTWTARQRLMLREMGLVTWAGADVPQEAEAAAPPVAAGPPPPAPAPQRTASPDPVRAPAPAAASAAVGVGPATDDRARHIATLDWPALRGAVAGCQACSLCGTRKQTVFGVGHEHAPWMIVGEAPGEQEDLQGEPFVGAAGQLLDSMLRALQLTRASDGPQAPHQRVYIANTLKCRPPRNRNPEPGEMQACEPFLMRQIALLQPKIIVAMGRFAVQALLRSSDPVGKLRGKVHSYQGVPLVVTYHPAYLLRNLPDKARAWDDLCLAASVAERSGLQVG